MTKHVKIKSSKGLHYGLIKNKRMTTGLDIGMNCGMEDTLVLDHFMSEEYPDDRLKAFQEYSKYRNPDAEAMCAGTHNMPARIICMPA